MRMVNELQIIVN